MSDFAGLSPEGVYHLSAPIYTFSQGNIRPFQALCKTAHLNCINKRYTMRTTAWSYSATMTTTILLQRCSNGGFGERRLAVWTEVNGQL